MNQLVFLILTLCTVKHEKLSCPHKGQCHHQVAPEQDSIFATSCDASFVQQELHNDLPQLNGDEKQVENRNQWYGVNYLLKATVNACSLLAT